MQPRGQGVYIYIYIYYIHTLELGCRFKATIVSGQYRSGIGPKLDGRHVLSMLCFFYIFDGRSIVMLTGGMYFL